MRHRTRSTIVAATGVALVATGAVVWASQATAATSYHDAAYGISASGAAPIGATPSVSSTDGQQRSDSGGARSSDGTISISSASVTAGAGRASAKVGGFTAFDGLVTASSATATCDNGEVSSSVAGTPAGAVGKNATVAYGVKSTNSDGSTTIIAMRVTVKAGAGTEAAHIDIASATCAAATGQPSPSHSTGPTGKPTESPTGHPTTQPTGSPSHSAPPTTPSTGGPTQGHDGGSGNQNTLPPAPVPSPGVANAPVTG